MIGGILCFPETGAEKLPLIICSHGFGGSYSDMLSYGVNFALHGIASYCFDFRGGGGYLSGGSMREMTVMTEVEDLTNVLKEARSWPFVDSSRVGLLGASQGGVVSALTAARHVHELSALILLFPAFVIPDDMRRLFPSEADIPAEFEHRGHVLGRQYAQCMWNCDLYAHIAAYDKPVLLLHGTADPVVPTSYIDRAAEVYAKVDHQEIAGGGHGFHGTPFIFSLGYVFQYLEKVGFVAAE